MRNISAKANYLQAITIFISDFSSFDMFVEKWHW